MLIKMTMSITYEKISDYAPELTNMVYIFPNGDRYQGECKQFDGVWMMHGVGHLTMGEHYVYTGSFVQDKMHGLGTLFRHNEIVHQGRWERDKCVE
jgi:hypothetical protein